MVPRRMAYRASWFRRLAFALAVLVLVGVAALASLLGWANARPWSATLSAPARGAPAADSSRREEVDGRAAVTESPYAHGEESDSEALLVGSEGQVEEGEGQELSIAAEELEPQLFARSTRSESTPELAALESYLLVGLDRRRRRAWGRADTILVVLFDPRSEHAGVVSIPRDLYVDIPGHGPGRINTTLAVAHRNGQDPLGLLKEVVRSVIGVSVDYAIAVDLAAFERTVDTLGGIVVEVPCAIRDRFHDDRDPSGYRWLDVPAGRVRMDGPTAAMYVRSRHGRSDWSRARRQQAALVALRDRLSSRGGLRSAIDLVEVLNDTLHTDLSRLELAGLLGRVHDVRADQVHGLVLGHRVMRHHQTKRGGYVLLPDYEAIDDAMRRLFEAPAPGALPERARCRPVDAALLRDYGAAER